MLRNKNLKKEWNNSFKKIYKNGMKEYNIICILIKIGWKAKNKYGLTNKNIFLVKKRNCWRYTILFQNKWLGNVKVFKKNSEKISLANKLNL